ncbi:hypothetical protein [Streptomyces sp. enrichment culture]|uniref:hypothetical protein n=1 Tax=Streptomyces sp. enrichment culture TaxID=1795815 RepID=UPI003F577FD3
MTDKLWAPTNSNLNGHHAYVDGRAMCNRRITPHELFRHGAEMRTREYVQKTPCAYLCERCDAKVQAAQAAAEETATDHQDGAPTLAQRAGVTLAMVGTGRRPHYTADGAETLCRRDIAAAPHADHAAALLAKGATVCALCDRAAQERAYARRLAAASPLAAATAQATAMAEPTPAHHDAPSNWWTITDPATGEEATRVYGETIADMTRRAEALPEVRAVIRKHRGFSRRRLTVGELTPAQLAEQQRQQAAAHTDAEEDAADRAAHRAADAVEHAETIGARVATVADAIALHDDQLAATVFCTIHGDTCDHDPVRRHEFRRTPAAPAEIEQAVEAVVAADLADGTWRGQWIGEPADDALFAVERPIEQGALFAPRTATD